VTEVAAPEGYVLADDASRELTIPRGSSATTEVFVNTAQECTEDCVEPTETPTPDPTESVEPTVEPSDPAPSISPTVKGVKIVKTPETLPHTGAAATTALLALGLGLAVGGSAIVVATSRYQRQH